MNPSPGPHDAARAIEVFCRVAQLNIEDPFREGSLIRLPGYGQAVMTGDLHGNRKNLEKLQRYAMLDRVSARHVFLHEMVHAELAYPTDVDRSHEVLLHAAEYKLAHPEQVHFLQSNHELAQLTGYPIAKNGRAVVEAFDQAVVTAYGEARGPAVLAAIDEFIASFPLAAITANRIWMSHSLPGIHDMEEFDADVFSRRLSMEELHHDKTVFHLVWGRQHHQRHIDRLGDMLEADIFLMGHQPQETGFDLRFDRLIILASDHNHGSFLPFDLSKEHTAKGLLRNIRKFVAVE